MEIASGWGGFAYVTYDHHANFFKVMRTRNTEELNTDIEEGHRSAVLIHLANISYRLGRTIRFDPVKEEIISDVEATRLLTREYRAPFVVPQSVPLANPEQSENMGLAHFPQPPPIDVRSAARAAGILHHSP